MAGQRKTPSEKRRRKKAQKRKKKPQGFVRPREWAEQELIGVLDWIKRLQGPEGQGFPPKWKAGQIRHYKAHARKLRKEIAAHKEKEKKP